LKAGTLTVVLVKDAVDDRVAAAGQEDEDLSDRVTVDEDTYIYICMNLIHTYICMNLSDRVTVDEDTSSLR